MTTIAAKQYADKFTIAWDHQITTGNSVGGTVNKVLKFLDGQVVIGVGGSVRIFNLIQVMDMPTPTPGEPDLWMTKTFIPALAATLKEGDVLTVDKGTATGDMRLIVLVEGQGYIVASSLAWYRPADGLYAIGSGDDFAIGAMYAGVDPKRAVEIAALNDVYTGSLISSLDVPHVRP